jgi:hypothetical protein
MGQEEEVEQVNHDDDDLLLAAIEASRVTMQQEQERRAVYAANRKMNEEANEWLDAVANAVLSDDDTEDDLPPQTGATATEVFGKGKEVINISSDDDEA